MAPMASLTSVSWRNDTDRHARSKGVRQVRRKGTAGGQTHDDEVSGWKPWAPRCVSRQAFSFRSLRVS